ncbi:MAG: hypothetical protein OXC06_04945 [Acidimicrobiaceae bacterium]|nr:hypothetical protein [Acidimicrobiaceae bacterium]
MALLAAAVASPNIRINDTNGRIDRLEDKMDARFGEFEDKTDARFGELEEAVAEIDLKLTALITHLNATSEVDNALAGRLTGPNAPTAARRPEP